MIASCGAPWQDSEEVQAQCLRGTAIPDALMGVPYTNTSTGRTYVNAYCAICNGEDPTRLNKWLFSVVCEDARRALDRPDHHGSVDHDSVDYDSEYYYSVDHDSEYYYSVDHDSVVYSNVDYDAVYFINGTWGVIPPGVKASASLPCHTAIADPRMRHAPRPPHHSTPPLTLLLSVSLQRCGPEEVLELTSGRCTKVTCPRPDEKFRNGRCVSVPQGAAISTQGTAAPYCPIRHSCAAPLVSHRGCRCDASCREYGDCCRDSHHYDEAQQMKNFASHTCVAGPTPAYMKTKCSEDWGDEEVQALCLKGNKTPGGSASLFPVTSTTTGPGTAARTSTTTGPGTAARTSTTTGPGTAARTSTTTGPGTAAGTSTLQAAPTRGGAGGEGLGDCPRVLLPDAELIRQTDGSLHVPAQGRTYHAGEYEGAEGGVLVCGSAHKFSAALAWVSTVGLSLSCLALALHLAAFCVAPSLRNLAGKCLASLCVALLAACGAMLASAPRGAGCVVLAAFRYYFWLCCFAWMTAMAQDDLSVSLKLQYSAHYYYYYYYYYYYNYYYYYYSGSLPVCVCACVSVCLLSLQAGKHFSLRPCFHMR